MKASVVIPTKNGGARFRQVLEAVLDQDTPWSYEIIVVDSGSWDGTVEYCLRRGVNVHSISPAEFGHGRTRNLAISNARGEFVALLTHDALPASRFWLRELVFSMEIAPDVAGAFGRHLPYREADPYTARDLKLHFDGFLAGPRVFRLEDPKRYERDLGYRQLLHFFSDNNACIRRTVWEAHPYPDVEFAEDQIWARNIIEAGYGKVYADKAAVFHSHSYSVLETARRSFDESAAFDRIFGYKLCPTIAQLLAQTVRCSLNDIKYSFKSGEARQHVFWMLRAPLAHFAKQTGYYLGSVGLPRWLTWRLSLDHALKTRKPTGGVSK